MSLDLLNVPNEVTEEELTKIQMGNVIPKGIYKAEVVGVESVISPTKGTDGVKFTYEIDEGDHVGTKIEDTLWQTDFTKGRERFLQCKLGVLIKQAGSEKYIRNPKVSNWPDVVGAKVQIEVGIEDFDRKDGSKGHKNVVPMYGVHRRDEIVKQSSSSDSSNGNGKHSTATTAAAQSKIPDDL